MELRDKVVVVTGGASGIGAGLVRRFCEEGVRGLVIADLNGEVAASLAAELGARSHGVDVRDESAIAALVADTEAEFGQIDLFCSNAGILNLDEGDYWATSSANDVWQRNWEIHVMAHIYAARACLPGMIRRGEGHFYTRCPRLVYSINPIPPPMPLPSMQPLGLQSRWRLLTVTMASR